MAVASVCSGGSSNFHRELKVLSVAEACSGCRVGVQWGCSSFQHVTMEDQKKKKKKKKSICSSQCQAD